MKKATAYLALSGCASITSLACTAIFARLTDTSEFAELTLVILMIYCCRPMVQSNALSLLAGLYFGNDRTEYKITRDGWLINACALSLAVSVTFIIWKPYSFSSETCLLISVLVFLLAVNDVQGQEELLDQRQIAYSARMFAARLTHVSVLLAISSFQDIEVEHYLFSYIFSECCLAGYRHYINRDKLLSSFVCNLRNIETKTRLRLAMVSSFRFGFLLLPATVAGVVINQIDKFVVEAYFDEQALALYGAAGLMGSSVNTATGACVAYLRPALFHRAKVGRLIASARMCIQGVLVLSLSYPVLLWGFERLVILLYGVSFSGSGSIAANIAMAYLWLGAYRLLTVNLEYHNEPVVRSAILSLGACIQLGGAIFMASEGIMEGPSLSMLFSTIFITLVMYVFQVKYFDRK